MSDWLLALVLGLVQGLTEFLPISSDGHLALLQNIMKQPTQTGADHVFFDVMLHLGTTIAIIIFYRRPIQLAGKALVSNTVAAPGFDRRSILRIMMLAIVSTLPLIPLKLFLLNHIKQSYQSLLVVGLGFAVTAVVLLLSLRQKGGTKGPNEMTWKDALLIGVAQAFAPMPGISRSGLTIATALSRGLSKPWSVGYSLIIAVPAILGAVASELLDAFPVGISLVRAQQIVVATVLAGAVGYFAILWLVRIVGSEKLWCFSIYLFCLSAAILIGQIPH